MDTVGDMITILINAQRVGKERVAVPHSRFKETLARFLQEKGAVAKVRIQEGAKPKIIVSLVTDEGRGLSRVRRLSKPGQRWYVGRHEIPRGADATTMYVLSTSQGLMDGKTAHQRSLGGELICEITQ